MNDVKRIIHNFKDVLSQKDMVEDTVDAFGKKGRRYLNLEDFNDISLAEKRFFLVFLLCLNMRWCITSLTQRSILLFII